jgi:hypothetical protein
MLNLRGDKKMSSLSYAEMIHTRVDAENSSTTTSVFKSASNDANTLHLFSKESRNPDGERHGQYMEWDENGDLAKDGTYENGDPLGQWFDKSLEAGPYYIPRASGDIDHYLCASTPEELDRRITLLWETGEPDPDYVAPPIDVDINL